jgi:hypothetical protein
MWVRSRRTRARPPLKCGLAIEKDRSDDVTADECFADEDLCQDSVREKIEHAALPIPRESPGDVHEHAQATPSAQPSHGNSSGENRGHKCAGMRAACRVW